LDHEGKWRLLESSLEAAQAALPRFPCYWIEPERCTNLPGFPWHLPRYCCAAELFSPHTICDSGRDCSGAILVWYQEWDDPILGDDMRTWARAISWREVGFDWWVLPCAEVEPDEDE
jgi:hypothetical protein